MSDCITCDVYRKLQREQKIRKNLDDSEECRIVTEYNDEDM